MSLIDSPLTAENLPRLIDRMAAQLPDRLAVQVGERRVTYKQLSDDVGTLAAELDAALAAHGCGHDAVTAISAVDPYRHWTAILAGLKLGSCTVSLSTATSDSEMAALDVSLVIGNHDIRSRTTEAPVHSFEVSAPARMVRSSGTTARAKVIALDVEGLARRLAGNVATYGLDARSKTLAMNGPATTSGFNLPILTWAVGGVVIFTTGGTLDALVNAIAQSTVVLGSPLTIAAAVAKIARTGLPDKNRDMFAAGARLPAAVAEQALALMCRRITIMYGAMEMGGGCRGDAALLARHPGAVGFPRPGTLVEIVGGSGVPLPAGVEGRIRMRSDLMVHSYCNDAATTAQNFKDGWFYPGDLGAIEGDGLVIVTGRVSDMMNIGGIKLAPATVETRLGAIAGVVDLCAVAVTRPDSHDRLAVAVVAEPNADWTAIERAIRHALRGLPPQAIFEMEALPVTDAGKLDRRRLAQDLATRLERHETKTPVKKV